jgi:hypothetical protein
VIIFNIASNIHGGHLSRRQLWSHG